MSLSRREMIIMGAAAPPAWSAPRLKLAVCSETFQGMPFDRACQAAAQCGYTGIEIEPAHLSSDPAALTAAERKRVQESMARAGLHYVGLHSFLKAPPGLHLTTADLSVRRRSWQYFRRIIDLAGDLGSGAVMVFGSGKQRAAIDGMAPADATRVLRDNLAEMAPQAAAHSVTILLEPLAPHLCNVVTTLGEAVSIAKEIDSPGLKSMLDTHNTAGEKISAPELIRQWLPWIRHVHLNEMDGGRPGSGTYDFRALLRQLRTSRYDGWLSVEVFDFKPDGVTVARQSADYIQDLEKDLTRGGVTR